MFRTITRTVVLTLAMSLSVTSIAAAKAGDRSFEQTYPAASALCAKVAAGQTPKRLRGDESQVLAACTKLHHSFDAAHDAAVAAQAAFTNGVAAVKARVAAACAAPRNKPACRAAHRQARVDLMSLRREHRNAVKQYYVSVEAARLTFWSTIRSLRGGSSVQPDRPIHPQKD